MRTIRSFLEAVLAIVIATAAIQGFPASRTSAQDKAATNEERNSGAVSTIKLRGKVVDQQTGNGVAGASVRLGVKKQGWSIVHSETTTDETGAFTFLIKPGKYTVNVSKIPEQYAMPSLKNQLKEIAVNEDTTTDDIKLERAYVLEGIVVDKSDNPVANANIYYHTMEPWSAVLVKRDICSDENGKFVIKGIPFREKISIRARTQNAVSETITSAPADSQTQFRLIIDQAKAFTLRGIVVNESGQPLRQILIQTTATVQTGNAIDSFPSETLNTDYMGKFEIGGLWPDASYEFQISATDFEGYNSGKVDGVPGGIKDFGKIKLLKNVYAIEGTVVDTSGKSIGGVRVFNSGDTPKLVQTSTNLYGQFELQGFHSGPAYIFAEKDGYRFTGLRTRSNVDDVVLKMHGSSEPVPQRQKVWSTTPSETEKYAAHKLLETMHKRAAGQKRFTTILVMDKIDPELATKWAAEDGVKLDEIRRRKTLEKIAEENLDEALSKIGKQGLGSYDSLKRLAMYFAASDTEKAMQCSEEAAIWARKMNQPLRAIRLAEISSVESLLGNKETAKKLADEALEMADKMETSYQNNYSAMGQIGVILAETDTPRAIKLLDRIPDKFMRDQLKLKTAIVLDDVEQVESLLKELGTRYPEKLRLETIYRIAAKHPAEAIRLVETLQSTQPPTVQENVKAMAFGWIAAAIAPNDTKLAHSLIDRAFAAYSKRSGMLDWNAAGNPLVRAAATAVVADRIGYPDMQGIVYRVLAARPPTSRVAPEFVQIISVEMLEYLAIVDPYTTQEVLQSLEADSGILGVGKSAVVRDYWLKAWALADPMRAVELAEAELTAAESDNQMKTMEDTLYNLLTLWLSAPDERLGFIWSSRDLMPPGKEEKAKKETSPIIDEQWRLW
jgi:hypothetical protein